MQKLVELARFLKESGKNCYHGNAFYEICGLQLCGCSIKLNLNFHQISRYVKDREIIQAISVAMAMLLMQTYGPGFLPAWLAILSNVTGTVEPQ